MIEQIISIIAPHECVGCHIEGTLLCADCQRALPFVPEQCYRCKAPSRLQTTCKTCASPLVAVYPATDYKGVAKDLLWKFKFDRAKAAAREIGLLMTAVLPTLSPDTIIVYVPTANSRVRLRGYDQAALLAQAIAVQTGLPARPLLARTTDNRQVGTDVAGRRRQMKHAFRVRHPQRAQNRHILLVDDVITTGASLEAAATALQQAGAAEVRAAAFARA